MFLIIISSTNLLSAISRVLLVLQKWEIMSTYTDEGPQLDQVTFFQQIVVSRITLKIIQITIFKLNKKHSMNL